MKWATVIASVFVVGSWAGLASGAEAATAPTNAQCSECHRDTTDASPKRKDDGRQVDLAAYAASAHAKVTCVECHSAAKADTHKGGLPRVVCGSCHAEQAAKHQGSAHATAKEPVGCVDCHGTHETLAVKNAASPMHPARQPETCARCHDGKKATRKALRGSQLFALDDFKKSIHYRGLTKAGLKESATCSSCHRNHETLSSRDPRSSVYTTNVPATCGKCHEGAFDKYMEGVHGQALIKGNTDTPVCTDCHGEHGMRGKNDPASAVYALAIAKTTCPQCHSAEHVNRRYGLMTNQVETYRETFHGLADSLGDSTAANCASCHQNHQILHSSNTKSSVNAANLGATCGKCHPGAGANWAKGGVHRPEKAVGGTAVHWVRLVYLLVIAGTIGGMLAYNGLDYTAALRARWRRGKVEKGFERFTRGERVQHFFLVTSFIVLVISGFSLRYPDAFWVRLLADAKLGFLARGYAHRIAAGVNIALCVYHAFYLAFTARGRGQMKAMIPTLQDAKDLYHQLRYYVGLEHHEARFGRYSYCEKVEYLALIWGTIVMTVTGAILWFETDAMRFLPKWGWDISEMVHLYEAWLATLSILVWHMYHVALKPTGHGVSLAMFNGKLSAEEMKHEHAAEYDALVKAEAGEAAPNAGAAE